MSNPIRIQRKRTKGYKLPPDTVCVTRPGKWGNPFVVGEYSDATKLGYQTPKELCGVMVRDNAHAAELFDRWIRGLSDVALGWRISVHVLQGKNLACFCPVGSPCHADTLLELANRA